MDLAGPGSVDHAIVVREIRAYYDEWRAAAEMRKRMKKCGLVTAIALTVVSLVTGLGLGLRKGGSNLIIRAKKITPAERRGR